MAVALTVQANVSQNDAIDGVEQISILICNVPESTQSCDGCLSG